MSTISEAVPHNIVREGPYGAITIKAVVSFLYTFYGAISSNGSLMQG